jgi:hypothetical protein
MTLITLWNRPAPADQPMGAGRLLNFDAHGPFRWVGGMMLMAILVPLVLRPVVRCLANGEAWARNTAIIAPLVTLWLVTIHMKLFTAIVPCAIVILICVVLRKRDMHFTRHDVVLVPVLLMTLMAVIDVVKMRVPVNECVPIAALVVLVLRLGVGLIQGGRASRPPAADVSSGAELPGKMPGSGGRDARPPAPGLAFAFAPLGLFLQTGFFARDQRYLGWHALAIVAITPFLVRLFARNERRLRRALAFFIFPLALFAYVNAMSLLTAEGKPRANFFEDGHSLMPASEYLRGELPFRDVLPAHGLFEDGFFDFLLFQVDDVNIGTSKKTREIVGQLTAISLYALAFAVTGSAEGAFLSVLFSIMTGMFAPTLRLLPSITTLAVLCGAIRWRRPRWFFFAGLGSVVCGMVSLDFGAYTFITLVVAIIRSTQRREVLKWAAIGIASGVVPLFLGYAIFGILDDFFYGTFVEVLRVGPMYTLGFFSPPAKMAEARWFPDILRFILDAQVFQYVLWPVMAMFVGVTITRRWSRRFEPLVLLGVWFIVTAISYAERHHIYFGMAASIVAVTVIAVLVRRRSALAIPAVVAAIVLANPTTHLSVLGWMRTSRGPIAADWVEVRDLPRARGAFFHMNDVVAMESIRKYLSTSLKPDETFLDFSNSAIVHFLYDRDAPVREYEVAFMQREETQREIIRRLESNPKIRAVMVAPTAQGRYTLDAVPNSWRAPILHQYILENFQPDFEEGEIAFWKRR